MPTFKAVSSEKVDLPNQWVLATKFNSIGKRVDEQGRYVEETYQGHQYRLIAKHERHFSHLERAGRGLLGLVVLVCSVGFAIFSKYIRDLLTRSKEIVRYGVFFDPKNPEPAPKAPLSPLLNLRFDPDHELMKLISKSRFLDRDNLNAYLFDSNMHGEEEANKRFSHIFDKSLLNISLRRWLQADFSPAEKLMFRTKEGKERKQIIDERIIAFKRAIQLEERLERLDWGVDATVGDLLPPWQESPLQVVLASDEQFRELKVSNYHVNECSAVASNALIDRIKKLARPMEASAEPTSVDEMLFIQIPHLKADFFNQHAKNLPPIVFGLVALDEIPNLKVKKLSEPQLNFLFRNEQQVAKLPSAQVQESLKRVDKSLLKWLTDQQILDLDLAGIDQPLFNAIFLTDLWIGRTGKVLADIKKEQFDVLQKYFSKEHWEILFNFPLGLVQVLGFVLRNDINQATFQTIFSLDTPENTKRTIVLLQALTPEAIEKHCQHFYTQIWQMLKDEQIIDFITRNKIDEKTFNAIFFFNPSGKQLFSKLPEEKQTELKTYAKF